MTISHYINGKLIAGSSGRNAPVFNPATGAVSTEVDLASIEEVDEAVEAARVAADIWGRTSTSNRTSVMFEFRSLLRRNAERLAQAITAEHGKVIDDALAEVDRGIENVEFACHVGNLLRAGASSQVSTGVDVREIRQALGVVAGITPFNFPVMVPLWMMANALACGNAFILKPSERDPSPSLILAELLTEAGLPDGVFNVVQGDQVAVNRLLVHPTVKAVSFVGSTPVAKHVFETGSANGKRVQALGGAKNHMVVLPDANLDAAADAATSAAFGAAGERCMAISVVVAVGDIAEPLVEAVSERITKLKVGAGVEAGIEMGPLITEAHRDRVASYIDNGAAEGASVVVDGRDLDVPSEGFFLGPTLLDEVKPEMVVARDEIFGPVLSVIRCDTYEEALEVVNAAEYGNGAAIFTADGAMARDFEQRVEAGMVGINVPLPVPTAHFSFGGWKNSLFGTAHMYGQDGVRFFTRMKVVTSRWPLAAKTALDFNFPRSD